MGMADVALELILIGLAQDGLLVRIGQLAEEKHVRRRAPDRAHRRIAAAGLDGIGLRLLDRLRVAAAGAPPVTGRPGRRPSSPVWARTRLSRCKKRS